MRFRRPGARTLSRGAFPGFRKRAEKNEFNYLYIKIALTAKKS